MRRPLVLLDLDQTLVDLHTRLRATVAHIAARDTFPDAFPATITDWHITTNCADTDRAVREAFRTPGVFANLDPLPGAIDAVRALRREAVVKFCTSPYLSNPTCVADKLDTVVRLFGRGSDRDCVITSDKTLVVGDILVDDKPTITGSVPTPVWELVQFDASYNRDSQAAHRILDWSAESVELCLTLAHDRMTRRQHLVGRSR